MLLRFRGPDGTVRITIEQSETFSKLADKVHELSIIKISRLTSTASGGLI